MDEPKKHIPVTRTAADARAKNAASVDGVQQKPTGAAKNTPWGGLTKGSAPAQAPQQDRAASAQESRETATLTVSKPRTDDLPQSETARDASTQVSSPPPATAQAAEAVPTEALQDSAAPSSPAPAPKKATPGGTNLNALRERILHESTGRTFHSDAATAQSKSTSAAEERAAKLERLRTLEGREAPAPTTAPGIDPIVAPKEKVQSPQALKAAAVAQAMEQNTEAAAQDDSTDTTPAPSSNAATQAAAADTAHGVRALRTYKMDLSEAMEHQQTSVAGAIASEEVRRSKTVAPLTPKAAPPRILGAGSYFLLGMSTVLVLVTVGVLFYFFVFLGNNSPEVAGEEVPTFFFTDAQEEIDVTGRSRIEFMDRLVLAKEKTNIQVGAVTHLYVTETSVSEEGVPEKEILSASDFLFKLDVRAPGKFYRSLNDEMMLGIHEFDGNEPFLVFKTNSFDNAYAGMLGWERTINADLTPLFGPILANPAVSLLTPKATSTSGTATTSSATSTDTTGTSSAPVVTPPTTVGDTLVQTLTFEDTFISNREVRVLRNTDDEIVLLWAFPDRQTLIIATEPATLELVVDRLNTRAF